MKNYSRFTENGKIRVREVLADNSYGPSIEREVPAHMVIEDLST